jgi:hypothetical protein
MPQRWSWGVFDARGGRQRPLPARGPISARPRRTLAKNWSIDLLPAV